MRALVTGGLGFIGSNLTEELLRQGALIRVLDNRAAPHPPTTLDPRIELVLGDVCDADGVKDAAEGVDAIIHLAAETGVVQSLDNPRRTSTVNVDGTLNVLEAARHHRSGVVVFASSNAVLGGAVPADEHTLPRPLTPYGATKLAGEALCTAYAESFGLRTVSLRFSNVYGFHSLHKGSAVSSILRNALTKGRITLTGDGSQTRDFLHAADLSRAVCLALERAPAGSVFQIGSGVETSILELAEAMSTLVREKTGTEVRIEFDAGRQGDVPRSVSNIDRARQIIGYSPEVPLNAGLRSTLTWFQTALTLHADSRR